MNWPFMVTTARKNLGESQQQFAKRFGVSANTVSRWELGIFPVSIAVLEWLIEQKEIAGIRTCPNCAGTGLVKPHTEQPSKEKNI